MSLICVISEVSDKISEVQNFASQVDDAGSTLSSVMQPILGGAWTGEGATAFIEEVQSRILPQIADLVAAIMGFGGGIGQAMSLIQDADSNALKIVGDAVDIIEGII